VEVEVLRLEREEHSEPCGLHDGMGGLLDVVLGPILVLDPARVVVGDLAQGSEQLQGVADVRRRVAGYRAVCV
jgi:hypothetical protein